MVLLSAAHQFVGSDVGNFLASLGVFPVISLALDTGIKAPILTIFSNAFHFRQLSPAHIHVFMFSVNTLFLSRSLYPTRIFVFVL